jgi:glutamate dehydrogenase (NAD(P)+)
MKVDDSYGSDGACGIVDAHFDLAAKHLGLTAQMQALMRTPYRALTVTVPLDLDDGSFRLFKGYRIQHHDLHMPNIGGIRYHPEVNEGDLSALAEAMTWKAALVHIPIGGAMGGVSCDPQLLSKGELKRLTQKYVARIHYILGPYWDIPTPDINTDAQVMSWMLDEYNTRHGHTLAGAAGKPGYLGGTLDRYPATGRGVGIVLHEYLKGLGHSLKGIRVAIQGFGNVGTTVARMLAGHGCKIVAIADVDSGVASKDGNGLPVADLMEYAAASGSVADFPGVQTIDSREVLWADCDVLIPAAMEGTLNEKSAGKIKARIVAEAANLPTSFEADVLLERRGITVLPDLLTNAGGVIGSYFEWVQNTRSESWQNEKMSAELDHRLTGAYGEVMERAAAENTTPKRAAYLIAIERIAREREKHKSPDSPA